MEGAAFTDGANVGNMDEKSEILNLLADGPQDAGGLSARLDISRNTLFSLLMKMEKEGLIEWKGREYRMELADEVGRGSAVAEDGSASSQESDHREPS